MTVTVAERAYLAGMVDADGHVIWRGGKHRAPTVGVTNCSTEIMEWLRARCGGSVSLQRRAEIAYPDNFNRRDTYKWSIVGERAAIVLRAIRPYLVIKGARADDLLVQWEASIDELDRPARRTHHIEKERAAMRDRGWD